ncbi:MAG: ascorbate-dependent monooxygenase [Acidobacteria bacterium]|nr:ascorbate-dependent monooxygenase [Acidobacteriota bacterium]
MKLKQIFFWVIFGPLCAGLVHFVDRILGQASPANVVTYNGEVAPILRARCQSCHHPGDIAPFSLMTYADAAARASLIKSMVTARKMPPWKPLASCGEFRDERRLSDAELNTIVQWVDGGAQEGPVQEVGAPLPYPNRWVLGEPDLVLAPEAEYKPDFSRGDVYRCFTLPTAQASDRFATAVDIRPGNRTSVHHVILFVDRTGASVQLDAQDPEPGYACFGGPGIPSIETLGGWAPGSRPQFLPEGVGMKLAAQSRVIMQVHYSATGGSLAPDRTSAALYFAKKPIDKNLYVLPLGNLTFVIPAGASRHEVTASFTTLPGVDAHLIGIAPHMHLLGRETQVKATAPDGTERCLIHIDDWDFQWQGNYFYKEPVPLKGGTRLSLTAYYDNSVNNPNNPNNPPKDVRWGEATTDEMCIAFISFTLDSEHLAVDPSSGTPSLLATSPLERPRLRLHPWNTKNLFVPD